MTGWLEPPEGPELAPLLPLVCVTTGDDVGLELGAGADAAPLVEVVTGADEV